MESLEFLDCLLLPGLVDVHAHPAPTSWKYGTDPDSEMLRRGTTTILSQGDAGAATWDLYKREIIEGSRTRVLLAISPAVLGESEGRACFSNLAEVDVDACVAAIEKGGESIWGIAVNLSQASCANTDPREVMNRTLAIAERTGKPLLFGARVDTLEWPLSDQMRLLRPGDVLTYCFRQSSQSIVADGRILDSVRAARGRGVLFDVGHGMTSFDFGVAEAAIADGFFPDTISSDFYKRHQGSSPPHDLPRTVSKLISAGMPERDALAAATARSAEILGLAGEVGTLAAGACADLAVLRWNPDAVPLADAAGNVRSGGCWEPVLTVRAGESVRAQRSEERR
jgi:dihydroorotase